MKILLTGTHFTPAQAVIEELQKDPQVKIVYLGRKYTREGDKTSSVESQVLPKLGVKFIPITSGRLQRSFTRYTIPSLLKVPVGFVQAMYVLAKEKPDVVLSFGGYVGVPVTVAAWLLSVPIIIHEQTLMPGLANKISAIFANKIALTLKENSLSSYQNTVLTGNPIRKELLEDSHIDPEMEKVLATAKRGNLPIIYITGGNQGSHSINLAVEESLPELTETAVVVHQCGDSKFNDFETLEETCKRLSHPERYLVRKWIDGKEVGRLFKSADLVVTRAGMNTLLETSFFAKPMLIVPLPVHKEQSANAHYFAKVGSARVLWQKDLTGENLIKEIKSILKNIKDLEENAQNAKNLVIADAAKRLALETMLLAKKR